MPSADAVVEHAYADPLAAIKAVVTPMVTAARRPRGLNAFVAALLRLEWPRLKWPRLK
jgi:hypothetical protein